MEPRAPVACSLGTDALAERRAQWRRLAAAALRDAVHVPGGARLTFRDGPDVAPRLRALAAAEAGCCGFARWEVIEDDGVLVLEATSEGMGVVAVRDMLAALSS